MFGPRDLCWSAVIATWVMASAGTIAPTGQTTMSGTRDLHVVRAGESLSSIGARFGIEPRLLADDNFLPAGARLRIGQWLVVDNRHLVPAPAAGEAIVVNIPQRRLFHFSEGEVVAAYPVAVGRRSTPTFVGAFTVVSLETDPVWDVPKSIQDAQRLAGKPVSVRVPPGPANPLGAYWIGLDRPGFGIHGTNAPATIFTFATHGCVRLHPDDIAALFRSVPAGATGRMIYEPLLFLPAASGAIFLEAHPDVYRRAGPALDVVRGFARDWEIEDEIDWRAVAAVLTARDGRPVNVARGPLAQSPPAPPRR